MSVNNIYYGSVVCINFLLERKYGRCKLFEKKVTIYEYMNRNRKYIKLCKGLLDNTALCIDYI